MIFFFDIKLSVYNICINFDFFLYEHLENNTIDQISDLTLCFTYNKKFHSKIKNINLL